MNKEKHAENGYEVECIRTGQVRRYGPTVCEYIVRDLTGERSETDVRVYCTINVCRADDAMEHPLQMHLQSFVRRDDGSYRYICGHDWTG